MTRVDSCEDDKERCWQVNVDAVEHLAKICKATGARLVQVSTDFIFDGQNGPYTEDDRPNPINYYGKSKLAAENIVRQFGLGRWSIVRAAMLYGTGENLKHSNLGLWMVDRLLAGQPFPVFTDQWRSFTYAPDLAMGIERIIRYRKSGVYHLSSPEYLSVYDFVLEMAQLFGFDASLVKPASWADLPHLKALRPPRTGFIILKAETELGFRPRSLRVALRHFGEQLDLQPVSSSS
jgi:dTDP-4-dehydrorhamnose reductase